MVGKFDKPKPWDEDPNLDRWAVEKFDPSWNEGGLVDVTSFSTLFPEYRGIHTQFIIYFFCPFFFPSLGKVCVKEKKNEICRAF